MSFLVTQILTHKCGKQRWSSQVVFTLLVNIQVNLLLSFRSGSLDLDPLPSPADSSAPANHRGSSELGCQSKWGD